MRKLLAALILALVSVPAFAGDVTVSMSGIAAQVNGGTIGAGQDCTPTSGWRPAIHNVGLCIHVSNSTASGTQTFTRSGTSGARIAVIADNKWGPLLSAGEFDQAAGVGWIMIEGLQFTGPNNKFVMLYSSGHDSYFEFNYVHDVNNNACNSATDKNGVVHATTAPYLNLTINGNVMRHFGGTGCGGGSGFHGFYIDASGLIFSNNIVSGGSGGWALQKQYASISDCTPGVISGNTIFNNQGGIVLNDEGTSNGMACGVNHWTISNNIIVNNGIAGTGGGGSAYGIDFFHTSHAPQTLVSNNLIYGNLPANINCGAGGCPAQLNTKTDASTAITFVNFQADTNQAPAGSYNAVNYQINSGSAAKFGGTTSCASGGISPCSPASDVGATIVRPNPPSIGAFEFGPGGGSVTLTSSLSFGNQLQGSPSAPQALTLTNGTGSSITIVSQSFTAGNTTSFSVSSTACGATVPAGNSCNINVIFTPQTLGGLSATFTVNYNAGTLLSATTSGTGTGAPAVCFTPAGSVSFGSLLIGVSSSPVPIRVTNCGNATLSVSSLGIGANPAQWAPGSDNCGARPFTLLANVFCTINPVFTPTQSGPQSGSLSVASNASGSPHTLNLTGSGNIAVVPPQIAVVTGAVTISGSVYVGGNPPTAFSDSFNSGTLNSQNWTCDTGTSPAPGTSNVGQFGCNRIDMSQGVLALKLVQTANTSTTLYGSIDQAATSAGLNTNCSSTMTWCGVHDADTPGTATPASSLVTSPSITGLAREFDCDSFTSSGGCRFSLHTNPVTPDTTSTIFTYDTWVNIPVPASINQLELDSNQGIAANTLVIYGTQCNFSAGFVDYTIAVNPTTSAWVHSSIPCTRAQFTAGYHHIVTTSSRDGSGNVTYGNWCFDGICTNFGVGAVSSVFSVAWASGALSQNFQFNGNGSGSATVYAALMTEETTVAGSNWSSLGAEVRSLQKFTYGTYSCTMRASSASVTTGGAGTKKSGSVSSCFSFNQDSGTSAPNYTEIDAPEFEGQGSPGLTGCAIGTVCAEFTNWISTATRSNLNSVVSGADTAFHTYTWVWSPGSVVYKVDGAAVGTSLTNVPTNPAYVIFNHYGTNAAAFGGTATAGTRWQYISNFSYTPLP